MPSSCSTCTFWKPVEDPVEPGSFGICQRLATDHSPPGDDPAYVLSQMGKIAVLATRDDFSCPLYQQEQP